MLPIPTWDEAERNGIVNFRLDPANFDRAIDVIGKLTAEFTKPEYEGAVTHIQPVNEPMVDASNSWTWGVPLELYQKYLIASYAAIEANAVDGTSSLIFLAHDGFSECLLCQRLAPPESDSQSASTRTLTSSPLALVSTYKML